MSHVGEGLHRLTRMVSAVTLIAALCLSTATPALGATIVLHDVDSSAYPEVTLDVALTADLRESPSFTVLENGIEVGSVRAQAAAQERDPVDVVLLVDVSGSMRGGPLDGAKAAARRFIETMRPVDRVALIEFSSEPRTLLGFTADQAALSGSIEGLRAAGETALYDGLIQAAREFDDPGRDRAILVLSDGGDTTSINGLDVAATAVEAAAAPVYAIALESPEYDPAPLQQLAARSGGRFIGTQDAAALVEVFEEIARELSDLYTVSFTSARPSTKSLEIVLRVGSGDVTGELTTVIENPIYTEVPEPVLLEPAVRGLLDWLSLVSISALVFGAVALGVFGLGSLIAPAPDILQQLRYYDQYRVDLADDTVQQATVQGSRARVMAAVSDIVEARGFTALVRENLERAGLPLRPNEYIYFHLLATMVGGVLVQFAFSNVVLTVTAVLVLVFGPIAFVRVRIDRRRTRFEEQLPDVLGLIAGSLRAGWGVQQALELVVDEIAEPASSEFRRVQAEARFGLPLEQALDRMAERLDSEDFRWTVTAIAIQREVGGNLAEVLDTVARTIRTRAELRRHVKALTAESRFSAVILAILPFFILGALAVVSPAYLSVMLNSVIGLFALGLGAVLLVIGLVWIFRLTKVEV